MSPIRHADVDVSPHTHLRPSFIDGCFRLFIIMLSPLSLHTMPLTPRHMPITGFSDMLARYDMALFFFALRHAAFRC